MNNKAKLQYILAHTCFMDGTPSEVSEECLDYMEELMAVLDKVDQKEKKKC